MKKYKVAFLTSHPIQYQAPLFKKLSEDSGIELVVYFCSRKGLKKTYDPGFGREIKWDVPLLEGYEYEFLEGKLSFLYFWRKLLRQRYDVIVIHGWTSFENLSTLLVAKIAGVSVILKGEADLTPKRNWLKKFFKKILFKVLFALPDAFLCTYSLNKNYFKHYGVPEQKLFFFPCAVDNDFFRKEAGELEGKEKEIRDEIGLKGDAVVILFVGKLIKRKRPLDLLKAFARTKNRKANLVFVGSGKLEKELKSYVENEGIINVYFAGFKNQSEISKFYTIADVFVLPSEWDPSPKVVNEAMNFRLPLILSSGIGTARDLISERENGHIFPVGDIDKLRSRLTELLKDENKRKRMGEKSFERVSEWSFNEEVNGLFQALKFLKNKNERFKV